MISFSHVYKIFPGYTFALKDVNLKIQKGEFVFLVGPSGSGKTSLFRILLSSYRISSGSVTVCNTDLNKIKEKNIPQFRQKIGAVYQDFKLLKDRTVYENVKLPLSLRKEKKSEIRNRVTEILEYVGLSHKINHYPIELSGGEQQRVAIARALVHHPMLLIADEPTGNLDVKLSEEIISLMEMINAQGTTVLVASHNLDLVEKFSKRTIHIQNGNILKERNLKMNLEV